MANNENINKVVYGNETLIDLTEDSVTPQTLLEGETAHDRSGAQITGSAVVNTVIEENDSFALVPTSEGNALARKIYGMSVQDGTPTPSSPVDIDSSSADFKCVGKNLFPYPYYDTTKTVGSITFTDLGDGRISINGTADSTPRWFKFLNSLVLKKGTYKLKCNVASGTYSGNCLMYINSTAWGSWETVGFGNEKTITLTEDTVIKDAGIRVLNATLANCVIEPLLILSDVTDQTYEHYKNTDITTNLTLRAIEVTSSNPYNLVKDGHYYIADTIDWDEVDGYTLTKRIGEVTFNGSETWNKGSATYADVFLSHVDNSNTGNTSNTYLARYGQSDRFKPNTDGGATEVGKFTMMNSNVYLSYSAYGTTSKDDFVTWITSNNVVLDYLLETPTKTSLTSAQAKALLSMRTYDESTSIDAVNAPAPVVELEYAKNRTSGRALTGHNEGKIDKDYEHISYAEYLQLTPHQIASGKYVVEGSSEATGIFGKVLTGSLAIGSTTVVLQDSFITTTSMIDVYTDVYGVSPTNVTVATGSITLTFEAQQSILNVKVRVM